METGRRETDSALVTTGDADGFGCSSRVCRGGFASDLGSGISCGSGYAHSKSVLYFAVRGGSLSQLWSGGQPRRTDSSWQPVMQAGALWDEAGEAWRQTGPSGTVQGSGIG